MLILFDKREHCGIRVVELYWTTMFAIQYTAVPCLLEGLKDLSWVHFCFCSISMTYEVFLIFFIKSCLLVTNLFYSNNVISGEKYEGTSFTIFIGNCMSETLNYYKIDVVKEVIFIGYFK